LKASLLKEQPTAAAEKIPGSAKLPVIEGVVPERAAIIENIVRSNQPGRIEAIIDNVKEGKITPRDLGLYYESKLGGTFTEAGQKGLERNFEIINGNGTAQEKLMAKKTIIKWFSDIDIKNMQLRSLTEQK
jgi:hypothetical protein